MRAWFLRRLLWLVPSFLGLTLVVFVAVRAAPGDPFAMQGELLGAGTATADAIREYRTLMGFDDPPFTGWLKWVGNVARGDFGRSLKDGRPVLEKVREALPVTLSLSVFALLLTYLVAIPVGAWSAVRRGAASERAVTLTLFGLYSLPQQWVAMVLILVFGLWLDWLPIQGLRTEGAELQGIPGVLDLAKHLVLPLVCLTFATFASLSRYVRSSMLEVLQADFIRTARAKGLPERTVILRHALRNALTSVVTLAGLALPTLVGGSVIVERIFGLPGMGRLSFEAILSKDVPVLMGTTSLAGLLTMLGLVLSDLALAAIDPRVRDGVRS